VDAQVQPQASPHAIHGEQSGNGTGFFSGNFSFSPITVIPSMFHPQLKSVTDDIKVVTNSIIK
jgi:hypothetical protein